MSQIRQSRVGLTYMLTAVVCFALMLALVKSLRGHGMTTAEVMFYRAAPMMPVMAWLLRRRGLGLRPSSPFDVAARAGFGIAAMATNFYSVAELQLVQASSLQLAQPMFVALAAPFILHERLRGLGIVALVIATGGALTILRPWEADGDVALVPGLMAVSSAAFSALAHIWVRRSTVGEPAERVVFHFAAAIALATLLWGLARGEMHFLAWFADGVATLQIACEAAGMAFFGAAGQLLMTKAYARTQAPLVAVVSYASIPISVALDVWIWGQMPTPITFVGAGIIMFAGFLLARSRV